MNLPPRGSISSEEQATRGRRTLFSAPVDPVTLEQAAQLCAGWAAAGGPPRNVVTLNARAVVLARDNPALRETLSEAALSVADGISITAAARLLGMTLPERVPGIDLMSRLLRLAAERNLRCYFLGARPAVIDALASSLPRLFPGLPVAGLHHGYFDRAESREIAHRIRGTSPHLLFVAFGMPESETWCREHGPGTGAVVTMSVGGSFDVLSGTIRRSPAVFRRIGLEWLWRLVLEPRKRFRVIFVDHAVFLGMLVRERFGRSPRRSV